MEYTLSYPFGKGLYYLKIFSSSLALSLFLFFITTSATALLTPAFITSFPLSAFFVFHKSQRRLLDAYIDLKSKKRHLTGKERAIRPYRKILIIFSLFIFSFSLILIVPGEAWMGGLLGIVAGHGIGDAIFYHYVRKVEERLKGEIVRLIVTEEKSGGELYVSHFLFLRNKDS